MTGSPSAQGAQLLRNAPRDHPSSADAHRLERFRLQRERLRSGRTTIPHRPWSELWAPPYRPGMRRFLCVSGPALILALLVGCSGPGAESGSSSSGGAPVAQPAAPADPGSASEPADADRQIVTTATASVVVKDPAAGAQRLSELVEKAGGRVDERSEQAGSGKDAEGAAADLVVRVPATALTGLLADLADLGDVEDRKSVV